MLASPTLKHVRKSRKTDTFWERTALCRPFMPSSQHPLPHFLMLQLPGRVGTSTDGKQFLCGACSKLEIPKQKRPQQGTGSTLANEATIRAPTMVLQCAFNYGVLTSRDSFSPSAEGLQGIDMVHLQSAGAWSHREPSPSG